MKKNWLSGTFIGLFLCLSLVLSLGMLVFGPAQPSANERLSDAPALFTDEGALNTEFLSQLADYVADRFFLRQELITADRLLTATLLNTSTEDTILLGKDGWLFYADTLDDHTGTAPMTDRELFCAARNLTLMAQYCQANGKQFTFMIAPNKNALYPQFMPDYGVTADTTDAQKLLALLEEAGVQTVDLFSAFSAESETLYFAHDSHWNSKGAALGADLINASFGVESSYYSDAFSAAVPHTGDLYEMLYPALTDPETDPVYGGTLSYSFTSKATQPDAIVLTTESDSTGTLLAYRDSFGNLLFPYLADSYGSSRFSRSTSYDLTLDGEYVLVELVQRNLSYLYTYVPTMAAPAAVVTIPEAAVGTIAAESAVKGSFTQISGQLPCTVDAASPIYVVSGGSVYEAFCMKDNGFAVNLPEGSTASGVICTVNGEIQLYTIS